MKKYNVGPQFSPKPPRTLGKTPNANVNRGNKPNVDSDKSTKFSNNNTNPSMNKKTPSEPKPAISAPKVQPPKVKLSK
jgi:hypothetical protein